MARLILSIDDQVMAEYNMTKERYTIGRLADNDIRIDNPTVSGHHSLIINILNDSFLEDLSSTNGTYVNGRLIKKHALQHGDVITIGRHQLRFIDSVSDDDQDEFASTMVISKSDLAGDGPPPAAVKPAVAPAAPAAEMPRPASEPARGDARPLPSARMQVLNGSFAGRELGLEKALTTLGRPGAQVVAITRRADGYHLVQVENHRQESVRINGQLVGGQAVRLNENDVIELLGIKMGFFSR
jgi:predicted component of type VI protein secretion system